MPKLPKMKQKSYGITNTAGISATSKEPVDHKSIGKISDFAKAFKNRKNKKGFMK